jgi:hypothetical protein
MKLDLTKHTLNLRQGDWDFLESVYQQQGVPTAAVVRALVSGHVNKLRNRESTTAPDIEVNIE